MVQKYLQKGCLKGRTVFKWVQCFQEGYENLKGDARSGNLSTLCKDENIDSLWSLVLSDSRIAILIISEALSLGKLLVNQTFNERLQIKQVYDKMVPKLPTPVQR